MDDLAHLIVTHEDWLTDRVIHYAHLNGQVAYTSTLREAWRVSVAQLSKPVVAALDGMKADGTPRARARERAADYCLDQARKHRDRGIDLDMFLRLLVFYRRSYLDLVEEHHATPEDSRRMLFVVMDIFDAIELRLVRDIVESKASEEIKSMQAANRALANEKNKFLTVFESLADPTIFFDQQGGDPHMNAAGYRILLGDDAPGFGYYGTPDAKRLRAVLAPVQAWIAQDEGEGGNVTIETAGGARIFSVASRKMLDVSGKFDGLVLILKDVTDYLAATEAAKDAERAKSALLAMFSHEIRTPINSILALTHLLNDLRLGPEQRRHIARLRESGRVLSDLVENILGLSRAEARALRRLDQEFDLTEMLHAVILTIEPSVAAKGLTIAHDIADDVPTHLYGDMQKLRHILMNLLSNAVNFTAQGSVGLDVSVLEPPDGARCRLRFAVRDTGLGLPPGATDWLFDPFTQYHHTGLEQAQRGSGLGLAICREFAGFLGGGIWAEARAGGGSRFVFELPFTLARRPDGDDERQSGLAVLLVEDDEVNASVTQAYLQGLGHVPKVVDSIRAAKRELEARPFDLVISDQQLGDGHGTDLARHLRAASQARLNALPIVLSTADVNEVSNLSPTMVRYIIAKPVAPGDLAHAIRQALHAGAAVEDAPEADVAGDGAEQGGAGDAGATSFEARRLDQMRADLGPDRFGRIIARYLDTASRLSADLSRGLAAGDMAALGNTAHKLAGASNVVGLSALAERAKQLLRHCQTATRAEVGREVKGLCDDIVQAGAELADYRDRSGSHDGNSGP
ncbi:MAG: response regulator [Rhodobacteraceae bacterium]|nr:MAG: response regulator [Paracoccaceae bacterium]